MIVKASVLGPCMLVSAYVATNHIAKTSVTHSNLRMPSLLGNFVSQIGMHVCVRADWPMEPAILSDQTVFLDAGYGCAKRLIMAWLVHFGGQNVK